MFLRSFLSLGVCVFAVCAAAQDFSALAQGSILICKDNQCVPTSQEMGRDYLVGQLNDLMQSNIGKKIVICEADSAQNICRGGGISFPVQSATIQTQVTVPQAKIVDARVVKDGAGVDFILDYDVRAGDTIPRCQAVLTRLGVASAADVKMVSPQFNCRLTETGKTELSVAYNISYIDLDRGIMGGFYTIAAHNALSGSTAGYALLQFEKGVEMEPGEIFPYPLQLEAIAKGAMPEINDPEMAEKMGAFWLKPTPFLNLTTPNFAPHDCYKFQNGCSAEMLNEPKKTFDPNAIPTFMPTPAGVISTTGLIQQTVTTQLPDGPAVRQTVSSVRRLRENGQTVLTDSQTRYYVQQTPDSPFVEETEKAFRQTVDANGVVLSENEMIENAQKDYQTMKQFEAETHQSSDPAAAPVMTTVGSSAVNVITPSGIVLTPEEQAYIERLSMQDAASGVQPQVVLSQGVPQQQVVSPISASVSSQMPVFDVSASVYSGAVVTPEKQSVQEEPEPSFWQKLKKGIDTYMYF